MADGTPTAAQAFGASRVRTPHLAAPETLMPPPSQLIGRDVATARLYPLSSVRAMAAGNQRFGCSNPSCPGDCRTSWPAQRRTLSPTITWQCGVWCVSCVICGMLCVGCGCLVCDMTYTPHHTYHAPCTSHTKPTHHTQPTTNHLPHPATLCAQAQAKNLFFFKGEKLPPIFPHFPPFCHHFSISLIFLHLLASGTLCQRVLDGGLWPASSAGALRRGWRRGGCSCQAA